MMSLDNDLSSQFIVKFTKNKGNSSLFDNLTENDQVRLLPSNEEDSTVECVGALGGESNGRGDHSFVAASGLQFRALGQVRNHGAPADVEHQE